jgi:hypothetical protein
MYVVYDPNHQVVLVDDLPKVAIINQLRVEVLDGDPVAGVSWSEDSVTMTLFTSRGVYTIERVEIGVWIK